MRSAMLRASYWPIRTFRSDVLPASFPARLGLFSFDAGSPLTAGTWAAAEQGAACAVAGARELLQGSRVSFSLSRPPATMQGDFFGGYCFVANAAVAAQVLRDAGLAKVAVLDIDYHHGNGTQAIFYERADVFFASVHGDPHTEYPYYLGYADERGSGAGEQRNLNLPLPRGTGFANALAQALRQALQAIATFGAERWWSRWGWTPSPATRSRASRSRARTTCGWARTWRRPACRRCSCSRRLCGRAGGGQRGERAGRLRAARPG